MSFEFKALIPSRIKQIFLPIIKKIFPNDFLFPSKYNNYITGKVYEKHPNIVLEKIDNLAQLNGTMQETYFVYMEVGDQQEIFKMHKRSFVNCITFEIFATFKKQMMY